MRSLIRLLAVSGCVLALVACGPGKDAASPSSKAGPDESPVVAEGEVAAAVEPAASLPPEDLGDFRIVSVLLGKSVGADKLVLTDSEVFASQDSIHASVLTTGAHQGLKISARWLAPDGSTIAETTQPLVPTGPTATTFDISNPAGWPAGEYQLQIGINKRTLQTRKFEVR
jgi:hypothetical protein